MGMETLRGTAASSCEPVPTARQLHTSMPTRSPNYTKPPVSETILGVQFDWLPLLMNAHLGAFWRSLGEDWPNPTDAPALDPQFERFGEPNWQPIRLQLKLADSSFRMQIKNAAGNRMIQVQNGRLHFNWIKIGDSGYPRYSEVLPGFIEAFEKFRGFVETSELGSIVANQWEVTYVNQIPQGTVWNRPADWGFFQPINSAENINDIAELESFSGEWHYVIPKQRGRLHVQWQHGRQPGADRDSIVLTLTARGPINKEAGNLIDGLNLGHNTIVEAFRRLMSDTANKFWDLKGLEK